MSINMGRCRWKIRFWLSCKVLAFVQRQWYDTLNPAFVNFTLFMQFVFMPYYFWILVFMLFCLLQQPESQDYVVTRNYVFPHLTI
jgi:hypothetical protein